MKRLVKLATHHMKRPTPEAREALINHPSLEDFRTAGDFCIDALEAPRLKSVEFAEEALPRVKLRHEPMKSDYRLKWDEMMAEQSAAASSPP